MKGISNNSLALIFVVVIAGVFLYSQGQQSGAAVQPPPAGQACSDLIAQNMQYTNFSYYQTGTGVVGTTATVYSADGAILSAGLAGSTNFATQQRGTYTILADAPGFFAAKKQVTTNCDATAGGPFVLYLADQDEAPTIAVLNVGGLSTNSLLVNSTIAAGGQGSFTLRYTPSAMYRALTNPELNEFTLAYVDCNTSNWDTSQMTASISGVQCRDAANAPIDTTGTVVKAWDCTGNAGGSNTNFVDMQITLAAQTGAVYDCGAAGATAYGGNFTIHPHDWYANTVTGAPSSGFRNNAGTNVTPTLRSSFLYYQ